MSLPAAGMLAAETAVAQKVVGQHTAQTAPVIIDGSTLFVVRGVSAYPAPQRAEAIRSRIMELAGDRALAVGDLAIRDDGDRSTIHIGQFDVLSVFDLDAELENISRDLLAEVYAQRIAVSVTEYRHDRSTGTLFENLLYALGVTALAALLVWGARHLFRWLDRWTERHIQRGVQELASKSHYLIQARAVWRLIKSLFSGIRTLVYLALAYFYLNTVLSLFPWSRPAAKVLFKLVLNPLNSLWKGFLTALPDLMFLLVLWFVVRYLIKIVRAFFTGVGTGRIRLESFEADWAEPTYKIVRIVIIAFALVIAYPYIPGSDSAAFKGVSVFIGVILSLGSSSFIGNMIAGLSMTYRAAFKVGDRIKVGEVVGTVEDIKLMVTRVRTPKNERVIMPNSNILNTDVVNYSQMAREKGLVLHSTVGIGYDTPWRQVEAMLLEAARRTDGLKQDTAPFVLQKSLGDFAVNYEINAYCDDADRIPALYSALHANIQDVFNENGVQIMSPAYEADPETPKIVPPEQWYAPPATKPE
jgi:small-conductance mechanosensitive channel